MSKFFNSRMYLFILAISFLIISCSKESPKTAGNKINSEASKSGVVTRQLLNVYAKADKFKNKTGKMEMDCSMAKDMKLTWWWDNNGRKQAVLLETPKERNMFLVDSSGTTSYNLETNQGLKQKSPGGAFGYLSELSGVLSACESEVGKNKLVVAIEDKVIINKKCKGYKVIGASGLDNVNAWLFDGIPMRIEIDMGNKVIFEAKSLETDITITSENFLIPKSVKLK